MSSNSKTKAAGAWNLNTVGIQILKTKTTGVKNLNTTRIYDSRALNFYTKTMEKKI
jgi:hypothetical protein